MSELDKFLLEIDRSAIHARAREAKDRDLRIATAVSLLVLEQSGRFTRELFATLRRAPVPSSTGIRGASSFDAATFETAAFIDYSLLAKDLGSPDDRSGDHDDLDGDDDSNEADPYCVAVRNAHHLTGAILNSLVSFSVNEKIFPNRPIAYTMRARRQGLVEMFEGILIQAVENGAPAALHSTGISLDLGLPVIVGLSARTFAITTLPALEEVARNVVEHAAELGFE